MGCGRVGGSRKGVDAVEDCARARKNRSWVRKGSGGYGCRCRSSLGVGVYREGVLVVLLLSRLVALKVALTI